MMYSFIGYFEGKTTGTQSVLSYLIQIRNQTIILILKITIDPAMRIMFMKNTEPAIIGGGRSSARETASRVVAGAIAANVTRY
jgi:chorismate synthase